MFHWHWASWPPSWTPCGGFRDFEVKVPLWSINNGLRSRQGRCWPWLTFGGLNLTQMSYKMSFESLLIYFMDPWARFLHTALILAHMPKPDGGVHNESTVESLSLALVSAQKLDNETLFTNLYIYLAYTIHKVTVPATFIVLWPDLSLKLFLWGGWWWGRRCCMGYWWW